ncbi:MAG: hypothetical protein H6718_18995 [Polyangiaceae bacterium]|nr:hypothetical protein [Polyangiaceae bacterium]MCB9605707.1 hypothetical protein [Polyangiaceae bacterium]
MTTQDSASGPVPAVAIFGGEQRPGHPLTLDMGRCTRLVLQGTGRIRGEVVPRIPLDAAGTQLDASTLLSPLVRLGAEFDTGLRLGEFGVHAEYEHELVRGDNGGADAPAGRGYPGQGSTEPVLRKANLALRVGDWIGLQGGFNTSHWGLGMIENDGAHDPAPGDTRFVDPRGGDRVLEARLFTGPLGDADFQGYIALQRVLQDERVLREDESVRDDEPSLRADLGLSFGGLDLDRGELHVALRRDEDAEGKQANYLIVDASVTFGFDLGDAMLLLDAEAAYQHGTTELEPTGLLVKQDLRAFAWAGRTTLLADRLSVAIDSLFLSGDSDVQDGTATGFRADPNYQFGVVLFDQVVRAQSARSVATATDPALGAPLNQAERLATEGGAIDTLAFFPRIGYRLLPGLDVYGGVLFAFAPVVPRDPANTRLAGGAARTALGGASEGYWGTEYDFGARFRALAWGSLLTLGVEGGALDPGPAMNAGAAARANGVDDSLLFGGRAFANYDF